MKHRIRAAGLLAVAGRLLLVLEKSLVTGRDFWIPPGGGFEPEDGSAVACVRREFLEETGLSVEVAGLVYVREYIETSRDTHHLELFFRVHRAAGELHATDPADPPSGSDLTRHARWFTRSELAALDVAPPELRDDFWDDASAPDAGARYLGVTVEGETLPVPESLP